LFAFLLFVRNCSEHCPQRLRSDCSLGHFLLCAFEFDRQSSCGVALNLSQSITAVVVQFLLRDFFDRYFGLGTLHQDPRFDFLDEAHKARVVVHLALLVDQFLAVRELDPLARITESSHSCNTLQSFPHTGELLSHN